MHPFEDLISRLLTAVTQDDKRALETILADHVSFHFPGRNRFAGEYFGRAGVIEFWSAHHDTLTPITLQSLHITAEQGIASVSMHVQRSLTGHQLICPGTCVYHIAHDQVVEWWYQMEKQDVFDAFWSYPVATAREQ